MLDQDASLLEVWWQEPQTFKDAAAYSIGPVLSLVLRLRGRVCLHASAVRVGEGALLFVGSSGSGKSTLAASMMKAGASVLGDDMAIIQSSGKKFVTYRGNGSVRLRHDSAIGIFGNTQGGMRVAPHWPKLRFSCPGLPDASEEVPIATIYLLDTAEKCAIHRLGPLAALQLLMGQLRPHISIPLPTAALSQSFDILSRVVVQVPVKRLDVPRNFASLAHACKTVMEDLKDSDPFPVGSHFPSEIQPHKHTVS